MYFTGSAFLGKKVYFELGLFLSRLGVLLLPLTTASFIALIIWLIDLPFSYFLQSWYLF